MTLLRTFSLSVLLLIGMFAVPQESNASSSVGIFFGFSNYHRPYFYRPYYYHRPYYGGFYRPYYYPYGYGYGNGYGYGYGYPYSYYRSYYIAEVRTEVKPQNARVYVDGDYIGVADDFDGWWQRLELPPGKHRLVFRAPGFEPYAVNIRLLPGRDAHIKYEMQPGQDQMADQDMRLPREDYERRNYDRDRYNHDRRDYRRSDRYRDRDEYDDDDDDNWAKERKRDRNRDREDKPYYGEQKRSESSRRSLILNVEPSDATVYIDGNYYGTANDNGRGEIEVLLPEGVHRVEVVRPGYSGFSQEVTVLKEGENKLTIRLEKK
ncbi:PEGA domain-containing protein [bacterium]|nr:PEGA domain-containing protein [bacterium]MCI0605218.1 PEGA domain-containing protein [bacterium]